MKARHFAGFILFSLALSSGVSAAPHAGCPNHSLGETQEDCPWAGVARALIAEADAGKPLLPKFKEKLPALANQIRSDSLHEDWKKLWGQSINYDELAKGVIIHPLILKMLEEQFRVSPPVRGDDRIVHAGLEHTYGYLFSVLKTPFGYKRARWVKPGANEGFQLQGKPLGPTPEEGTFFSNATYFLGNVAFRDRPEELKILKAGSTRVAKSLTRFQFSKIKTQRIVETVEAPLEGKQRTVTLRTDLVPFTVVPAGQKNTHLLIYSVVDGAQDKAQLITAFPIEASFVEKITAPDLFGDNKPVITRYNGYVSGLTGGHLSGKRALIGTEAAR